MAWLLLSERQLTKAILTGMLERAYMKLESIVMPGQLYSSGFVL